MLELYAPNCGALLAVNDDIQWPENVASRITWTAPSNDRYHIHIKPYDWRVYGIQTGYTLLIKRQ